MNMKRALNEAALAGVAIVATAMTSAIPVAASAVTTITVDSVVQRWPWNNKVDITYTVSGGQDLAAGEYKKIIFTTVIEGTTYTIDGTTDVGASANAGTHTVTWTLPPGVKDSACTMSAAVYASAAPSGNDYMIIDLAKTSDNVTYEGLLATQEASNDRYNKAEFKTDKLVLRKVPAGGPYPTGDSVHRATGSWPNPSRTWMTDRDYYVGIFPVTQYQYNELCSTNPASHYWAVQGDVIEHRPVERVSWNDLRVSGTAPTSSIPAVASNSGTFFQRLNFITGNKFRFDLPTQMMFEIAQRAGATTYYTWGNTTNDLPKYCVYQGNSSRCTAAVGSHLPNSWGLYDTSGNVWEWCLDDYDGSKPVAQTDALIPACTGTNQRRYHGSAHYDTPIANTAFYASSYWTYDPTTRQVNLGFRVSRIAD